MTNYKKGNAFVDFLKIKSVKMKNLLAAVCDLCEEVRILRHLVHLNTNQFIPT